MAVRASFGTQYSYEPAPSALPVSDRLGLRRSSEATASELYEVFDANRHRLHDYTDDSNQQTLETSLLFANVVEDQIAKGIYAPYDLVLDGAVNGHIELTRFTDWGASLAYWRAEDGRREGFMSQAAQTMVDFGFSHWGLQRVFFEIAPGNVRSEKVAQSVGAVLTDHYARKLGIEGQEIILQTWELRNE